MLKWDAVIFTAPNETIRRKIERYSSIWCRLGLLSAEEWMAVEDACQDVGSAGSALNALLVATERLCALKGYTVLNEGVLAGSRILIVLVGEEIALDDSIEGLEELMETQHGYVHRCRVTQNIRNVERIAARTWEGVWITGTNVSYSLVNDSYAYYYPDSSKSSPSLIAFSFDCCKEISIPHGIYEADSNTKEITSLSFRIPSPGSNVLLALLFLPPPVARHFLSLHSVYPLIRSTYHGLDSGSVGLKLSLFFDIVLASVTCEEEFFNCVLGGSRIDSRDDLRRLARREIRNTMQNERIFNEKLDIRDYRYCSNHTDVHNEHNQLFDRLSLMRTEFKKNILKKIELKSERVDKILRTIVELEEERDCLEPSVGSVIEKHLFETPSDSLCMAYSSYLFAKTRGKCGLRNGPALNSAFRVGMNMIGQGRVKEGMSEMIRECRENWMNSNERLCRAGRHFEAAAQIITSTRIRALCEKYKPERNDRSRTRFKCVEVRSAARIDLYGGWLDTPPITFQYLPSAVVNVSVKIDDKKPIRCLIERTDGEGILFTTEDFNIKFGSLDEIIESSNKPEKPGSLLCACFLAAGIVVDEKKLVLAELLENLFYSRSIRIETESNLPHGSGLGTSSILASTIVAALWTAAGYSFSNETLVHRVLLVEQILSTAGGWQDQVGAIYPGFKIGSMTTSGVETRLLNANSEFLDEFNKRMVLIYTGKTRLAKNLLQQVLRNFYSGGESCSVLQSMSERVIQFAKMIEKATLPADDVVHYFEVKKTLAEGCEPDNVSRLIADMKRADLLNCACLAGAGGGGFLYVYLKSPLYIDNLRQLLQENHPEMSLHTVSVDLDPFQVICCKYE